MEDKNSLKKIKKRYKEFQEKYSLEDFDELNKVFQIEKISESETDFLLREIRKIISEKFSDYLRFVETILNPMNNSMFVFSVVKSIDSDSKKILTNVYKKLAKMELKIIELDLEFSEEKEAEFIKDSCEFWKDIRKNILTVLNVINKNWDNKSEANGKGYFG